MSDKTAIEWAANADGSQGATWNPIVGCSVLSPGCKRCYAMRTAARHERQCEGAGRVSPYAGLTRPSNAGPVWTGEVRLHEPALLKPLTWRTPRTVFVNSMSDLFHEDVHREWIDRVFAVMALCPQHTFIVLTKRSARMRVYMNTVHDESDRDTARRFAAAYTALTTSRPVPEINWPPQNVWLGVSVENNDHRDRLTDLVHTHAIKRVLSAEPLLAELDVSAFLAPAFDGDRRKNKIIPPLDWVIIGGESGGGARDFDTRWAVDIHRSCQRRGVACFIKQLGSRPRSYGRALKLADRKGGDPLEWPDELRGLQLRQRPKLAAEAA
jgi:protein gp37